jgi:hypothetical protein
MTVERKMDVYDLRSEIAVAAARLIAEEGVTYEMAKKRAARQLLGNHRQSGKYMPDNQQVEEELRIYQALFMADTQPGRLLHLRQLALKVMHDLGEFQPYVTGAVLNGTAGEMSDIHLQLFADSAKDVEIFLLNKGVDITVTEATSNRQRVQAAENIHFYYNGEVIHLAVYNRDDIRKMTRASGAVSERADMKELALLIDKAASETRVESSSSN